MMQYDPLHHILLKMQTSLNITARDLARERQDKMQVEKQVEDLTNELTTVGGLLSSVVDAAELVTAERDALKLEVEELKKLPTTPKVVAGGEDHL